MPNLSNDGFNPIELSLIRPLDPSEFSSNWITELYTSEALTQEEYLVLDFIGINGFNREGSVLVSFQGLKRSIELHQARLTKAVKRLIKKELLVKSKEGYSLTKEGILLFKKLSKKFDRTVPSIQHKLFFNVAEGNVQGLHLSSIHYNQIKHEFLGRWFGKFRFVAKFEYHNAFEICWVSTNGSISASMKIGPNNNIRLSLSAPIKRMANEEIQLLIDHISNTLERILDAPVIINNFSIYENTRTKTRNIAKEVEYAKIPYAG